MSFTGRKQSLGMSIQSSRGLYTYHNMEIFGRVRRREKGR